MSTYGDRLNELGQIREQEFMLEATMRRASRRRSRIRTLGLISGAARRLRRRADPTQT